jgi:uncharacterized damage-inducible protein DinB
MATLPFDNRGTAYKHVREHGMKDHFEMMAAYNRWANQAVYEAAAALTAEELESDRGAFFGSMIRTLNHLLCADRIWMRRLTGEGEAPRALDTILFPELGALAEARRGEDERIISYVGGLDEASLASTFSYTPVTNPQPVTQRLGSALAHFFNHQTHHRGQCHMILTSLGKPSLTLDLIYFQRVEGRQWL